MLLAYLVLWLVVEVVTILQRLQTDLQLQRRTAVVVAAAAAAGPC